MDDGYTLITGASEGLGKAFALECAKRKQNLILLALPFSGLEELAAHIRQVFRVDVLVCEMDIAIEENCTCLIKTLEESSVTINILINNAGIGSTAAFSEITTEFCKKQIQINITSLVLLTHLLFPLLNKQCSYILNVSSLSTFFYLPKKQVYGATKSFVYFFSKSLRKELFNTNISVSVLCPGGMNSNPDQYLRHQSMSWIARLSVLEPREVARITVDGLLRKKETIIPGKLNRMFLILDKLFPQKLKDFILKKQTQKFPSFSV